MGLEPIVLEKLDAESAQGQGESPLEVRQEDDVLAFFGLREVVRGRRYSSFDSWRDLPALVQAVDVGLNNIRSLPSIATLGDLCA